MDTLNIGKKGDGPTRLPRDKGTTFLQDIPFISTCFTVNTSKCKILQKEKRLFCKTFVNAKSYKKRLFCKIFHLLVYVLILTLVNAQSCKKENDFLARYSIY